MLHPTNFVLRHEGHEVKHAWFRLCDLVANDCEDVVFVQILLGLIVDGAVDGENVGVELLGAAGLCVLAR